MRFLLPPSPGVDAARRQAPLLEAALRPTLPAITVDVASDYSELGDDVVAGRCMAAWVPPIVAARIEMAGGHVVLRAVRNGSTAYRAALVCRAGETFSAAQAPQLIAAWVDEDSAAGFLLARSWLAARHVDAITGFKRAFFTRSYVTALQAVADGGADITSIFASVAGAPPLSTLDEVDASLRARLAICSYTEETGTDGVAVGPATPGDDAARLASAMAALSTTPQGVELLRTLMQCEDLRPASQRTSMPQGGAEAPRQR